MRIFSFLFACVLIYTPVVNADNAAQKLTSFFTDVITMDAVFTQEVLDERGNSMQRSSGTVQIHRPGRFRWEYNEPYPQLILADGKNLWVFDKELEQATVKPLRDALGSAPIMLLTESRPLEDEFEITAMAPRDDGLEWLQLIPKVKDTEFNRIEFGMDQVTVRRMELFDQFGQKTVIRLDQPGVNVAIPSDHFRFTVPDGVDLVGSAE